MVPKNAHRVALLTGWGGWPEGSIPLDVGFSNVAEALGDGEPLESVTPETLLAIAFSASDSSRLLKITPMEFVGEWESAIDDRAGLEDVGTAADGAYVHAFARQQQAVHHQVHQSLQILANLLQRGLAARKVGHLPLARATTRRRRMHRERERSRGTRFAGAACSRNLEQAVAV